MFLNFSKNKKIKTLKGESDMNVNRQPKSVNIFGC